MLIDFLLALRAEGLRVGPGEWLALLGLLDAGLLDAPAGGAEAEPPGSLARLHALGRLALVKDETLFDRYDRAFGRFVDGLPPAEADGPRVPEDWLIQRMRRQLSAAERAALQPLDREALLRGLEERLATQRGRHEGGSRWIGTGGSSPYGHGGSNPRGLRLGGSGAEPGQGRAIKVWQARDFRAQDVDAPLQGRALQLALRRLRRFAREGAAEELDLPGTIAATAANAGWLDLKLRPERHNHVKVLLMMDVGGSMDPHIRRVDELFRAARSEFKHLQRVYFHNCVYEGVWRDPARRRADRLDTAELIRATPRDHRLILVGDATMSPFEITHPGGSVEHMNPDTGAAWLQRLFQHFPQHVWLNPVAPAGWGWRPSIGLIERLMRPQRMFSLSLAGLEGAMASLSR